LSHGSESESAVDAVAARFPSPGYEQWSQLWISERDHFVWQFGDCRGIGTALAEGVETRVQREVTSLLLVQCKFLTHYFHLERVERSLAGRVRQQRHGGGVKAIQQIERERQRLGRELHTGVGQMLAAIRMQLDIVTSQLVAPPTPVEQALSRISVLATEALQQVRSISKRLHPPEWQRLTLEAAIRQLWDISGIPEKFEARLQIGPLPNEPDLERKVLIYRAAQEAVSNLIRHSHATRAELSLKAASDRLVLTVRDNGVGFDAEGLFSAPASIASGIGLRSIRDQAAALGGKLILESGRVGTTLEVSVPL
jgi:signal transduction histidine kinase